MPRQSKRSKSSQKSNIKIDDESEPVSEDYRIKREKNNMAVRKTREKKKKAIQENNELREMYVRDNLRIDAQIEQIEEVRKKLVEIGKEPSPITMETMKQALGPFFDEVLQKSEMLQELSEESDLHQFE